MTIPINLHPQYIINEEGKRVSVILPIEEFNKLIENQIDDLSYLSDEVEKGFNYDISFHRFIALIFDEFYNINNCSINLYIWLN